MSITFILGHSPLKRRAFEAALAEVGIKADIALFQGDPGVDLQPVGRGAISAGAHNRAKAACTAFPGAYGVGIESGIVRDDEGWFDTALVVIMHPDGRETGRWTWQVPFPEECVEEARKRGFDKVTVGEIVAEKFGGDAKDPHATLSEGKTSRHAQLVAAIIGALKEAQEVACTKMSGRVDHYDVVVGRAHRRLPVREVAPGVRVAVFNILGDWELTEEAGKTLVSKLAREKGRVDALVMPEGKATGLLHVMGRELGIPTYVARKEHKPYMGNTVQSVTYRSITTNREQSLHLSNEDAQALANKNVLLVDDVVSTGGTIEALKRLMADVGVLNADVVAVFCEGKGRSDVTCLGVLPLF